MKRDEFDVHYYNGKGEFSHKYEEGWEATKRFCPNCGARNVWHETDPGDYYVGEEYLCLTCDHRFYLPMGVQKADGEQDKQRLDRLRKPKP